MYWSASSPVFRMARACLPSLSATPPLGPGRPVLSLSFNAPGDEAATERKLQEIYSSRMKLPPFFSNLLPEGVLRDQPTHR
jgi:hypothetical protein